ncbi:hypothetical protein ACFW1A_12080 [Kitasatospora sp. NPDC058965]|uniref:hypothetical protein n=1 Tax=Kitasatospora sp. NPDC058965 TaxID=3346682 RepID=UPI0036A6FC04
MRSHRITLCAAAVAAAALLPLTSCGSSAPSVSVSPPLGVDEHANGSTVHLALGGTLVLTLHSTYWSAVASSAPGVLSESGSPGSSPGTCPPGGGCGTVTTVFRAQAAGSSRLTASRTSCGEAMPCPPDQRTYQVTVVVGG